MYDALSIRMKSYETPESGRKLMKMLPALARIDGRCFSAFTKDMYRPYDDRLTRLMIATAAFLAKETNANVAYTQSDEISLAWYQPDSRSDIFFAGKIQKMTSQLSAMATLYFNRKLDRHSLSAYADKLPTFDARVWNVPTIEEAINYFIWREQDASKNSVSMAARCYYSHNELMNKNQKDMQEMLFVKGMNWNDYPITFKRGTFISRQKTKLPFTKEEIDKLPEEHEARKNPQLTVLRTEYVTREHMFCPFSKIINQRAFLFYDSCPVFDYEVGKDVEAVPAGEVCATE